MKQNIRKYNLSKKELQDNAKKRDYLIKNSLELPEVLEIKKNIKYHNALYHAIKLVRILSLCKSDFPKRDFLDDIYKKHPEYRNRPIIFAPNHLRKDDTQHILEAIKPHMALLSGDYENLHRNIGGPLIEKNGIIYFDMTNYYNTDDLKSDEKYIRELEEYIKLTNSKELIDELNSEKEKYNKKINSIINDRANVKVAIDQILENSINLLWFYEGSWNLSCNKPYYDGSFHMVQAAIDNNALVIPVSYDLIKNKIFKRSVVMVSDPIDFRKIYGNKKLTIEEKKEGLDIIKGAIGNNLFNIWEKYCKVSKDELYKKYGKKPNIEDDLTHDFKKESNIKSYFDKYMNDVLKEWYFTLEEIDNKHFADKDKVESKDAFSHLDSLRLNKNNAFLASKRNHN